MEKIAAIKNGDAFVFQQVFNEYHEKLYFYVLQKAKSEYIAEEAVQLTFIKLWQYRNSLNENLSLSLQLFRIAKTTLIDLIRKQCHATGLLHELKSKEDKTHFEVQEQVEFSEINRHLAIMINKMPPMRKKVFELSRLEGKSHKEIAGILLISTKTVEKHISQALKQIRSVLG